MEVIETYAISLGVMKCVFFGLVCFSILRIVFEMQQIEWILRGFDMALVDGCRVYVMKCFFMLLLFFSVLLVIIRLMHHIHPIYHEVPKVPPQFTTEAAFRHLLVNLTMDDMELVGKLKAELVPVPQGRYNFQRGDIPFKEHVLERAVRQLNVLRRGYFVEVGAGDGELRSPTTCLETEDRWRGLLVEADPRLWSSLVSKKRKVHLGLSCVGLNNTSYQGILGLKELTRSKLVEQWDSGLGELAEVTCYPLYTYLLAVGQRIIDFLVVNINGEEVEVLRTLPWNQVTIYVIAVCYGTKRERLELTSYLNQKGYHLHKRYNQDGESFLMFVKFASFSPEHGR